MPRQAASPQQHGAAQQGAGRQVPPGYRSAPQAARPQGARPARAARSQGPRPAQAARTGGMVPVAYGAGSRGSRGGHGGAGGPGARSGKGSGTGGGKRGPWRVVFWVALAVLLVALVALGALMFSYWQGQQAYDAVAEDVFEPPTDVEGASLADLTVDWDKLLAINPDTVGWIYIPGTPVNYPIVHTSNDEKYLSTDFNGQQAWGATYGSIFLAAANASDFSDANNIVYGHHLNNGSMFACIAGFEDPAAFDEHRTAYLLTPQGNLKLRSFSLMHVAADDPLAQTVFADDADRTAYVQDKLDRSVAKAADAPAAADITRMFAFATCDNLPSDGRYVLFSYPVESTVAAIPAMGAGADGGIDPQSAAIVEGAAEEAAA